MGKPRLDKYSRLLARFFEVIIVLHILCRVTGPHTFNSLNLADLRDCRRRFIKNLAFICDYGKGGNTTTSVAIEKKENGFKFWVTSNAGPPKEVVSFLNSVLALLKRIPMARKAKVGPESITKLCCDFSKKRILEESRILSNAARRCEGELTTRTFAISAEARDSLIAWLRRIQFNKKADVYTTCQSAYDMRTDAQMQTLLNLGQELVTDGDSTESLEKFRIIRHLIGRLANHIRVTTELIQDSTRLAHLTESYRVDAVTPPPGVPPPQADSQTNLNGIIGRMPLKGGSHIEYEGYMKKLDDDMGLMAKIMKIYEEQRVKPRVHCEIQMLEKFYQDELEFAYGDRFIGTSKYACLFCKLYFRHHPAACVEPDSHQKIYLNCGPILLPEGGKDEGYVQQRDLMNLIRNDLCLVAQEYIKRPKNANNERADSVTGLTTSDDLNEDLYDLSELEGEFPDDDGIDQEFLGSSIGHEINGDGGDGSTEIDSDTEGGVEL